MNQLLAPYPQLLHFTLSPLIDQALEKLVKNLAKWFPICFNPLWVDVSKPPPHPSPYYLTRYHDH